MASQSSANFKASEDLILARAYVAISTDAAVGTDQNGDRFWSKIAEKFQSLIGADFNVERTGASLKNRWNGRLAKACSKFTGCLTSSLKKYHSGWNYDDYVTEAKRLYRLEVKKEFSFESVYNLIKHLPKFAVDPHSMAPQVCTILDLDISATEFRARPEIGKKAAKKMKFDAEKRQATTAKADERVLAINRLAKATKEKTKVLARAADEKAKILFFNALPDSAPEKQQFISLMAAKFLASEQPQATSQETSPATNTSKHSGDSFFDLNKRVDLSSSDESGGEKL